MYTISIQGASCRPKTDMSDMDDESPGLCFDEDADAEIRLIHSGRLIFYYRIL